jgi:peptidoglycan pentaglycine glycine transferase (the first glycine)
LICILTSSKDLDLYDKWITNHADGNLWQSTERKKYLESLGKEVRIYALKYGAHIRASALVSIDTTTGGYSTWEIPRGPVGQVESGKWKVEKEIEALMEYIIKDAKKGKCIALYVSPHTILPTFHFPLSTFRFSRRLTYCEATRIVDLTQSEVDILAQMKQKGRYNIKVAIKKEVSVTESKNIDAFYALVEKTGTRDGFTHLSKKKYESFLNDLPGSFLLMAYDKESTPIAGVLSVVYNGNGIYYYGASDHTYRASMAPYLLQWESMRLCKSNGCTSYDLLGIAPEKNGKWKVESGKSHPWAGISSFKEKFGGEVKSYPQERIIILKPLLYWMLQMKRKLLK